MSSAGNHNHDNPGGKKNTLPVNANLLDKTAPVLNGKPMRLAVGECSPYDLEGGWLREFRKACDRFLRSRGIDPADDEYSFRTFVKRESRLGRIKREAKKKAVDICTHSDSLGDR